MACTSAGSIRSMEPLDVDGSLAVDHSGRVFRHHFPAAGILREGVADLQDGRSVRKDFEGDPFVRNHFLVVLEPFDLR